MKLFANRYGLAYESNSEKKKFGFRRSDTYPTEIEAPPREGAVPALEAWLDRRGDGRPVGPGLLGTLTQRS